MTKQKKKNHLDILPFPLEVIAAGRVAGVDFPCGRLDKIKQWVMAFGPEACVEEPEELRKLVKEGMKRTLAHYEKTSFEYGEKIEAHAKPQRCEEKKASVSVCVCLWLKINLSVLA